MNQLKKDLQLVLKSLKALTLKVEKMQKQVAGPVKAKAPKATPKAKVKAKAKPVKKVATKKTGKEVTAYDTFLGIINKRNKGVSIKELKARTGFDDKKIANLVYKAKKQGKIKSEQKGIYKKA